MDFEFSDEQQQLRTTARALLAHHCTPERVRQAVASPTPLDAELWEHVTELGWLSVALPSNAGGFGTGFVEASILLEEVGRSLAPVPYLPTLLAIAALSRAGEAELVQRLASGDRVGAAGWDSQLVVGAPQADVVVKATNTGVSVVDPASVAAQPAMDLTRTVGWVTSRGRPIGDADAAEDLLARAAVGSSALLLGGATRVLDMTTQYVIDRHQFGRPIGSFQAVKHHCANMLVDVEAMRSVVYWAAWCIDAQHRDALVAASAAKAWCAEAGLRVIEKGLQLHGGLGFTWDHDLHLYLKRANLDQMTFGSSRFHLDRLAGLLRTRIRARVPLT
jgi:alkylation response protein AidB-like acyl-CoA dehydrogenase